MCDLLAYCHVLGAETPASGAVKSKDTTPVKESMALPSEESRQKIGAMTDSGKTAPTRVKTESKMKHESVESPEVTAGKPTAATPASQVIIPSDVVICKKVKGRVQLLIEPHLRAVECHLSYGITQCYLPPDTSEHIPP